MRFLRTARVLRRCRASSTARRDGHLSYHPPAQVGRGSILATMPRNPHPHSMQELEHDDAVYGPAESQEAHHILVQLTKTCLLSAMDHISDSRALLAKIEAKFPGYQADKQDTLSDV
jgi:hypothetical protein